MLAGVLSACAVRDQGFKRGCDRKALAGSQAMTGKAYRPDGWAAGVACDSDKRQRQYFRERKSTCPGVDLIIDLFSQVRKMLRLGLVG